MHPIELTPISWNAISAALDKYRKRARLGLKITIHDIRKIATTTILQKLASETDDIVSSLIYVQHFLGHVDWSLIFSTYTKAANSKKTIFTETMTNITDQIMTEASDTSELNSIANHMIEHFDSQGIKVKSNRILKDEVKNPYFEIVGEMNMNGRHLDLKLKYDFDRKEYDRNNGIPSTTEIIYTHSVQVTDTKGKEYIINYPLSEQDKEYLKGTFPTQYEGLIDED